MNRAISLQRSLFHKQTEELNPKKLIKKATQGIYHLTYGIQAVFNGANTTF